jgi:glycosyltransferase involved in cell wall biosynthesis
MNIYSCIFVEEEDSLWHQHLTRSLRDMGHKVFTPLAIGLTESLWLVGEGLWSRQRKSGLSEKILTDVKEKNREHGIALFFCYLFPFQFVPELFRDLEKTGIPTVYFFPDNLSHKVIAREYAPYVTLNWVPELAAMKQFSDSGSRAIHLAMAANPRISYPLSLDERIGVSFVGLKTALRREMLGKAAEAGLDLRIYGNGWRPDRGKEGADKIRSFKSKISRPVKRIFSSRVKYRLQDYLKTGEKYEDAVAVVLNKEPFFNVCRKHPASLADLEEANKIYSLSSVSIGFNDQFNEEDGIFTHTNLRNFEAACSAACYLAQDTPDIREFFEEGKEIMIFNNAEELIDKAKFLLKNEGLRRELRRAARQRALSEHTWGHRFHKVFSLLGLEK